MRRLLSLLILLYSASTAFAQSPRIDSLQQVLENTTDIKGRVDILNNLASDSYHYDISACKAFAAEALSLSESVQYTPGQRLALLHLGLSSYGNARYEEAFRYHRKGILLASLEDDLLAYQFVMLGNVHLAAAHYDSAAMFYRKALSVERKLNSDRYVPYAYKNLARLHVTKWQNDSAAYYFEQALALYQQRRNQGAIAEVWFGLVEVNKNLGRYDKAAEYIEKGCKVALSLDDRLLKLTCLMSKGENHYKNGEYTAALHDLFKAIELMEGVDMPLQMTRLYLDLGDVYDALGQNEMSMKYFMEALRLAERIGARQETGKALSNIAWINKNQGNFKLAHEYLVKALKINRTIGDAHGLAYSYNIKGVIFLDDAKYDSALLFLNKALAIREKIGDKIGISTCKYNQGLVLEFTNQLDKALEKQFEALAIDETAGNKFTVGMSYNSIGSIYTQLRKFKDAAAYLRKAEETGKETGSLVLQANNVLYWSDFYRERGDFKKALEYFESYTTLDDSIYSEISAAKLAEMHALYQVEKKDQEIQLLNQERQIQENKIALQKTRINLQTIIIASIVLGLILVVMLALKTVQYNKQIKKAHRQITEKQEEIQAQSEELIEANAVIADINKDLEEKIAKRTKDLSRAYKELDTFFYRSSHDFRRPLTTFLGLAEVANVTVRDPNALELFDKVKDTAINLDKMLVKLQSISDLGSQQLVFKEVSLHELFDSVCDDFRDEIQRNGIETICEVCLQSPFVSYPAMIRTIIENMVENGIHFCARIDPFIRMKAYQDGDDVVLEFHDNGVGIARQYHHQIFDMYFRGNDRSKGNGLGLYIVKKAVEKLDGSVNFTSVHGSGTTFTVRVPNNGVTV
ncbi:MAG TPA: tetratricopeptide repeat-containing sensor histidine kinase [Chryseosolibacter sp.]|nr:tetratricopeptide repeat-containing sensor histidine kinase [Chryseosolibacter sp.]